MRKYMQVNANSTQIDDETLYALVIEYYNAHAVALEIPVRYNDLPVDARKMFIRAMLSMMEGVNIIQKTYGDL